MLQFELAAHTGKFSIFVPKMTKLEAAFSMIYKNPLKFSIIIKVITNSPEFHAINTIYENTGCMCKTNSSCLLIKYIVQLLIRKKSHQNN